tara:strand:+ start:2081 stop:2212 length:132 start_codon:yes stop_codon:yes gene_type:complete
MVSTNLSFVLRFLLGNARFIQRYFVRDFRQKYLFDITLDGVAE